MKTQDDDYNRAMHARLDGLFRDVLTAMDDADSMELIGVGVAMILMALRTAREEDRPEMRKQVQSLLDARLH